MLGKLLLLFTVVPIVELYLLITVGQSLGTPAAIAIVLLTGLVGASLARREGARVLRNWQESMARGEMPKDGVVSSALVLVGGVLLVTPGVVTDVIGLLLLVPWSRRAVARIVRARLQHRLQIHSFVPDPGVFSPAGDARHPGDGPMGPVIDAYAVEVEVEVEEARGARRSDRTPSTSARPSIPSATPAVDG